MSLRNTNDEATLTLDGVVTSAKIVLDTEGAVILSTIVQDRGDGYRPITPLTVKIDTVATALPTLLAVGHHVI